MMMTSEVADFLAQHLTPGQAVICAVSGGLDSMCLLHMVQDLGYAPLVAHFHHGLRGQEADCDAQFVESWCRQRGIPWVIGHGDVMSYAQSNGKGVEESARTLRYEFLQELSKNQGHLPILTAHHATDNAETMLFNLLRGTGMRGLCGIPSVNGNLLRPLLSLSRKDLEGYATLHHLPFVEDGSNVDVTFSRNRLRHQVLPILEDLNPKAVAHLYETSQQLRREDNYLNQLAQALSPPLGQPIAWETLRSPLGGRVVLMALEAVCGHRRDFTAAHIGAVCQLTPGGGLTLPYGIVVTSNAKGVFFAPPPPKETALILNEPILFGSWQVRLSDAPLCGQSLGMDCLPSGLVVRPWTGRDRLTQQGKNRSVKRRINDLGLRGVLPVVSQGDCVVAVACLGVDQAFLCKNGKTPSFYITFLKEN